MPEHTDHELAERFENLQIDAETFSHLDHVATGFAMLRRYPFLEAAARYARTINTMATQAGAPDKYNTTITLAFMSLIAERMDSSGEADWQEFIDNNPDLTSGRVLARWYSRERLGSPLARRQFVLPDRAC